MFDRLAVEHNLPTADPLIHSLLLGLDHEGFCFFGTTKTAVWQTPEIRIATLAPYNKKVCGTLVSKDLTVRRIYLCVERVRLLALRRAAADRETSTLQIPDVFHSTADKPEFFDLFSSGVLTAYADNRQIKPTKTWVLGDNEDQPRLKLYYEILHPIVSLVHFTQEYRQSGNVVYDGWTVEGSTLNGIRMVVLWTVLRTNATSGRVQDPACGTRAMLALLDDLIAMR